MQVSIVATVLLAADFSYRWIEAPSRKAIRHAWALREQNAAKGTWLR